MNRNNSTQETTPFHIFKHEVAEAAGLSVDRLHLGRLHTAYDNGEPVWMVADEMKLRSEALMPSVKPYRLPCVTSSVCVRRIRVE